MIGTKTNFENKTFLLQLLKAPIIFKYYVF